MNRMKYAFLGFFVAAALLISPPQAFSGALFLVTSAVAAVWGTITGSIGDQSDLATSLAGKVTYNQWTAFTPTGSWTTNTTYSGFKKVVGDDLFVSMKILFSGTPDTGSLTVNLPAGCTIDTAKEFATGDNGPMYWGECTIVDTGAISQMCGLNYLSTTSLMLEAVRASQTYVDYPAQLTRTVPFSLGNTDTIWIRYRVPIVAGCS